MSKKADHIHKYQRMAIGNKDYIVYRCMIPNCAHYLAPEFVINKESQCWGECQGTLIVTQEHVGRSVVRPKCRPCIEARKEVLMASDDETLHSPGN